MEESGGSFIGQVVTVVGLLLEMATPTNIAVALGALAVLIGLRLFGGGFIAFWLRVLVYAGAVYLLARSSQFTEAFAGFSVWTTAAATAIGGLWLPATIVVLVLRMVFGRSATAEIADVGPGGGAAAARGIYAPEYGKEEQRQISTIMMTDIVGYSKKMSADEAGTYELLKEHNAIIRKNIKAFKGHEIKTIGDAFMIRFASPIDAVRCAMSVQREFANYNAKRMLHEHIRIRIGINTGEMILTKNDAFGEGVNIAARLEPQCEPGGIVISSPVYEACKNQLQAGFISLGVRPLKNIANPPEIFKVMIQQDETAL